VRQNAGVELQRWLGHSGESRNPASGEEPWIPAPA